MARHFKLFVHHDGCQGNFQTTSLTWWWGPNSQSPSASFSPLCVPVVVKPILSSNLVRLCSQNLPSRQINKCVTVPGSSSEESANTNLLLSWFFRISHSLAEGPLWKTSGRVGEIEEQGRARSWDVERDEFMQLRIVVLTSLKAGDPGDNQPSLGAAKHQTLWEDQLSLSRFQHCNC